MRAIMKEIRKKREKDAEIEHERKMDNTRNINPLFGEE